MLFSRRHLLYAMLGALALAGVSGILALFTSAGNDVWRIAFTGLVVAIAAGIMMPMSSLADKQATRTAGIVGMGVCVFELILAAMLIWGRMLPPDAREMLAWTAGIIGPCGLAAVAFLRELAKPGSRWTALVGAGGCGLAAASWLIAAGLETFGYPWALTTPFFAGGWAIAGAGIISAVSLTGLAHPDPRPWRWIGVVASCIGMVVAIYASIVKQGGNAAWLVGPYAAGAVVAHAVLALRLKLTPAQSLVRIVAMVSAFCTALTVTFCFADDLRRYDPFQSFDWVWRIAAAFGLLCASSSMGLLVLGLLNRRPKLELTKTASFDRIIVICPRCEKKLNLPLGGALCDGCRLHINVSVHTARCAQCNYDLTGLSSQNCPEFGTPIPAGVTNLDASV